MAKKPICIVTCLRCGDRQRIRRAMLDRAAGVRCKMCGGPVELSEPARKLQTDGMDAAAHDPARRRYDHGGDNV